LNKILGLFALLCALMFGSSASAEDHELDIGMNVGLMGMVDFEPEWTGEYIYFGPSITVEPAESWYLAPGAFIAASPKSGYWGFMMTMPVQYMPGKISIDLVVPAIGQDTAPNGDTEVFWAVGLGTTLGLKNGTMLAFTPQVVGYFGEKDLFLSLTLNYFIPIPSH